MVLPFVQKEPPLGGGWIGRYNMLAPHSPLTSWPSLPHNPLPRGQSIVALDILSDSKNCFFGRPGHQCSDCAQFNRKFIENNFEYLNYFYIKTGYIHDNYYQSAIVGTQRLTVADAVSIKKPQGRYKLTSPGDRTTLRTPVDVTTVALDVLFLFFNLLLCDVCLIVRRFDPMGSSSGMQ